MSVVDRIEANQRGEQAPVGFGQVFASQIAMSGELRFQAIQFREQRREGFFVGCLGSGEAGAVDAVVHRRVDARVEGVDFLA
ncbi:hypothetical protein D3C78_1479920 [compost metagenome]